MGEVGEACSEAPRHSLREVSFKPASACGVCVGLEDVRCSTDRERDKDAAPWGPQRAHQQRLVYQPSCQQQQEQRRAQAQQPSSSSSAAYTENAHIKNRHETDKHQTSRSSHVLCV